MNKSADRNFVSLIIIFFLAFGLFVTLTTFSKQIATLTRAKEEFVPSSESSLIFAWPLTASTVDQTPVEINVFIRNANNTPISDKRVALNTNLGTFTQSEQITDKSGKSTFYLTSQTPGIAEITGTIDGRIELKQKITIKFE